MLSELIKTPVKVTNYICIFKHIQKDGKPNVGASVMKMLKATERNSDVMRILITSY